jgi:hypothetical protein
MCKAVARQIGDQGAGHAFLVQGTSAALVRCALRGVIEAAALEQPAHLLADA